MRFVIVTGMSGAGRSTALKILEDCGYYCADNLPISLLPMFAQLMNDNPDITKAAVGIDIRNGKEQPGYWASRQPWCGGWNG